jgi:flagellar biosynthesis protein FlhG
MFDNRDALQRLLENRYSTDMGLPPNHYDSSRTLSPAPQVIAVSGGKGGVGKTMLTTNLAIACADLGKRVLLIDGDLGLSNVDVLLNLRPRASIDNVLAGECRLSDVVIKFTPWLDVIPASSGHLKVPDLSHLHKIMLLDQVDELETQYDLVLIDTSAGVSRTVQYWAASAARVAIVVTPEPTSLADGYATMKILNETTRENRFSLIVNMVQSLTESMSVYERFSTVAEEFLGVHVSLMGGIVFDQNVRSSIMQRSPLVKTFPFSKSAQSIVQIATQINENNDAGNAKGTAQFFWKRMINYSHSEVIC